jgi:biopolymer transport protein ExbD
MDRIAIKRIQKRLSGHAELNVTPFMSLFIVLVPALLVSMVFTHITIIDLNFPAGNSIGEFDPEAVHLEVVVRKDALIVADGRGGTIKAVPNVNGVHDYKTFALVIQEVKRRMQEKRDITILLERDTDYQTVVAVMDRVRSFKTLQALQLVEAELFPVISLGDAPAVSAAS